MKWIIIIYWILTGIVFINNPNYEKTLITIHIMPIDTQRNAFNCYNLHFLKDWHTQKIFVGGIISMLTPGAVQMWARIFNLNMGDWLKTWRESSSINSEWRRSLKWAQPQMDTSERAPKATGIFSDESKPLENSAYYLQRMFQLTH